MCNAGEKIKSIFEVFTKQKIGFRFVLFLSVQTLLYQGVTFSFDWTLQMFTGIYGVPIGFFCNSYGF